MLVWCSTTSNLDLHGWGKDMAFKSSNLKSVASAGRGPLWAYKTMDALNAVTAAGYFNPARDNLALGDMISVTQVTGQGGTNEAFIGAADYRVTALTPNVTVV